MKRNNKKSLCEKTMKIVVNIMKISSLSLAQMSLGSTAAPQTITYENSSSDAFVEITRITQDSGQLRLQELENSSNLSSLFLNPNEGKASSYVIREVKDVNEAASDYIHKFHDNNRKHASNFKVSPYVIPPPPPPVVK
ncbi:hypothetical protein IFM89_012994 [Coptis chinensis]|uniref:Uncharacterized protein n=1 Tax=Coptis chinensis TaxID=261450 RepID=A0A835MI88_9MAGN|nr:hypothetical protein IFM89_012994 [Coptis chinensis]